MIALLKQGSLVTNARTLDCVVRAASIIQNFKTGDANKGCDVGQLAIHEKYRPAPEFTVTSAPTKIEKMFLCTLGKTLCEFEVPDQGMASLHSLIVCLIITLQLRWFIVGLTFEEFVAVGQSFLLAVECYPLV